MRTGLLLVAAAVAGPLLAGCGAADTTQARLQDAVGPTFGGLYVLQGELTGGPRLTPGWVNPAAACSRRGGGTSGGGDWTCTVTFRTAAGSGRSAVYEVQAKPGGCYTAAGPPEVVGSASLRGADGSPVRNPLARFDGCFDTT